LEIHLSVLFKKSENKFVLYGDRADKNSGEIMDVLA
jgi:hypothetical protein